MTHTPSSLAEQLDALTPEQRQSLMQKLAQKRQANQGTRESNRLVSAHSANDAQKQGAGIPIIRQSQGVSEFPLSKAQERLWFLESLEGAKPTYHIACALNFDQPLKLDALNDAMTGLVNRHQVLRARLIETRDGVKQVFSSSDAAILAKQQINGDEIHKVLREAVNQPFDLTNEPPFRVHWYESHGGKQTLLLVMHHIVSDAWTAGVLLTELSILYTAKTQQQLPNLPALNCDFTDYVFWQNQVLEGLEADKQLPWWEEQLAKVRDAQLPLNRSRERGGMEKGAFYRAALPKSLLTAFSSLCQSQQASVFHGLMAVFQTLLYRVMQQNDFAIGTPFAGREHQDTHGLAGLFVNTLPILNDAQTGLTFTALLSQVRNRILAVHQRQHVPFEVLVDKLNVPRDTLTSPLFQVFFSYQADNPLNHVAFGNATATFEPVHTETAKFDLSLMVQAENSDTIAHFEYNAALFDEKTIQRLQQSFVCLLEAVCLAPNQSIDTLPMVSEQEKLALFAHFGQRTPIPATFDVASLIEQQAKLQPERIAVRQGEESITYGELNQKANGLAKELSALGVQSGQRVGLHLPPSIEFMAGLLATIKLGAAYVPMDTQLPDVRLHFIAEH
ncbi:MAG: condensation domain-containing protein, partial [Cellvibrionales bacterium]|nr:condensation domain-containing protein [Cellvibrionales bacterium]